MIPFVCGMIMGGMVTLFIVVVYIVWQEDKPKRKGKK